MNGYVNDFLACPSCTKPLSMRPYSTFFCGNGNETVYEDTLGISNLLPVRLRERKYNGRPKNLDSTISTPEALKLRIGSDDVKCLLGDVVEGNLRAADDHVSRLIKNGLPKSCYAEDGRLTRGGVHLVSATFQRLFEQYHKRVPAEALHTFIGIVTQARYEAELQAMGDYPGSFVLPDGVVERLPRKGVVVELGMGNGANLKKLADCGEFDALLGFDFCYGMVQAARERNGKVNIFHSIGDAHYPPVRDDVADVVVMLNALDRLQKPRSALRRMGRFLKNGATVVMANCMPLQYDIPIGELSISCVPDGERVERIEDAMRLIGDVEIVQKEEKIEWHPVTVTQDREDLYVDVVVGKVRK